MILKRHLISVPHFVFKSHVWIFFCRKQRRISSRPLCPNWGNQGQRRGSSGRCLNRSALSRWNEEHGEQVKKKDAERVVCFFSMAAADAVYKTVCLIEWDKWELFFFSLLSSGFYSQGCTVGNITTVTVSDASFPFGYDQTQFDLCLDVPVLKDNLYSVCEKVVDEDFQKVILKKLNQVILALIENYGGILFSPWVDLYFNTLSMSFSTFSFLPGIPVGCVRWASSAARLSVSCGVARWHRQVERH